MRSVDLERAHQSRDTLDCTLAAHGKVVVVSNRGPVLLKDGRWVRSSGGLVTALEPLLRRHQGVWVSADELAGKTLEVPELGYKQRRVRLSPEQREAFYTSFANGVLWPILHGFPSLGQLEGAPWDDYEAVNRAFAQAIAIDVQPTDLVWLHDYHLMRVPLWLREARPDSTIGWFCHVPWPGRDGFAVLPWRGELLRGLLQADVVGFHSTAYAHHFLECVQAFTDAGVERGAMEVRGRQGRTRVAVCPVGIPTEEVRECVESNAVEQRRRMLIDAVNHRRILLGVDRLDYTKGIVERLSAFARLLEENPPLQDALVLVQIVVPSRESVDAYAELKLKLEQLVGQINGRFSRAGRVPIHYVYGSLSKQELYAHYRAADVALVTPLRDGMNLVALEYVAARTDEGGALVLSEFAGAAEHLKDAHLVNPYDVENMSATIERALNEPLPLRKQRMRKLRAAVLQLDVHVWTDKFLGYLRDARQRDVE